MSTITHLRNVWRNIVHRGRVERDLDDELRSVFEQLAPLSAGVINVRITW